MVAGTGKQDRNHSHNNNGNGKSNANMYPIKPADGNSDNQNQDAFGKYTTRNFCSFSKNTCVLIMMIPYSTTKW